MIIYIEILPDYFMIMKWRVTLENLKPIMPYINITGGLDYIHMSKIMCTDVGLANNSKLIDLCLDPLIILLKELNQHDLLQIAPWTSSLTCHLSTDLILFWSW